MKLIFSFWFVILKFYARSPSPNPGPKDALLYSIYFRALFCTLRSSVIGNVPFSLASGREAVLFSPFISWFDRSLQDRENVEDFSEEVLLELGHWRMGWVSTDEITGRAFWRNCYVLTRKVGKVWEMGSRPVWTEHMVAMENKSGNYCHFSWTSFFFSQEEFALSKNFWKMIICFMNYLKCIIHMFGFSEVSGRGIESTRKWLRVA